MPASRPLTAPSSSRPRKPRGAASPRKTSPQGDSPRRDPEEKLTISEVCAELKITRSTFYDWRSKGKAPQCSKLPNGAVRIIRCDLDAWYKSCEVA